MTRPALPDASVLIRTDYTDDVAWTELATAAQAPSEPDEFTANLVLVEGPAWDSISVDELLDQLGNSSTTYVFLADAESIAHPDHPILAVETSVVGRGQTVRVIASRMSSIENNLSLANMDFVEFVEGADADGVFRGF
ncbi:hypothetical protein GOEFS_054_00210 [Gordonia effusa NBRC 100432]|uniref:DUF6924 domain-containing protein n=1 Tax=Gordonia effusa NBRC 100432 TaxID=1077974 RepID=H0R007_9ACTN|nr:hypothetical protein [Gordonia effusa]GAB18408.1 hypothetical protein GOEFS_054_00210 [Gordonia effusa NBRC 100432]